MTTTSNPHDVEHTTVILASAWDVLRYVAEPANLPDFLPGVVSARPAAQPVDGNPGVIISVKADDGGVQDVTAWIAVDEASHRIRWGLAAFDYHGELEIDGGSNVTQLRAVVHAERPVDHAGHQQIQHVLGCLRHQIETSAMLPPRGSTSPN